MPLNEKELRFYLTLAKIFVTLECTYYKNNTTNFFHFERNHVHRGFELSRNWLEVDIMLVYFSINRCALANHTILSYGLLYHTPTDIGAI